MADVKTTNESDRTIDGTEYVRLATSGANWKATLANIFGFKIPTPTGSGTVARFSDTVGTLDDSNATLTSTALTLQTSANNDFVGVQAYNSSTTGSTARIECVAGTDADFLMSSDHANNATFIAELQGRINFSAIKEIDFEPGGARALTLPQAGGAVVGPTIALATTATDGFLYIPTCNGLPTGVPTARFSAVPMVYDTSTNKLYIYNSGWKGATHT